MAQAETERALISRMQAGDSSAVTELSSTYGSRIHQLAFRYLKNWEDAEEVVQDVLLKVHRKIGAFRGDAALSSWIYRITFNAAMSRLRTAKYQRIQNDELSITLVEADEPKSTRHEIADWSDLADEQVLRSQLRKRVARAILALPAIYRAPVMLRRLGRLTGMAIPPSSVLYVPIQALTLWDVHVLFALERWKRDGGRDAAQPGAHAS